MKQFSKKTDMTLLILSLAVALTGSVIIALSGNLLYLIQDFLETRVFNRTFSIAKWADTINALMVFPIFIAIFFDSIFFVKFSKMSKIVLLCFYAALTVFFIIFCTILKSDAFMDSDMASEILLAKECWLNKTFWPRSWHYSTEFRLLNTQLFAAPIFAFTSNWHIVKIVSSVLICLLLPLSMWFLLRQLRIKSVWVKAVFCLLILCPWSLLSWRFMQYGNYYIPHVAMSFVYVGLCVSLIYNQNTTDKYKAFKIIFFLLSFICGLSSIRYILQFQFPLAVVTVSMAVVALVKEKQELNIKEFFFLDKKVFYPVSGLLFGCLGYIVNSFVLSKFYTFSNFNLTKFSAFNEVPVMRWLLDVFTCFGYCDQVGVITPSGVINVFVYIFIVFFMLCVISIIRKSESDEKHRLFVLYAVVMFVFNMFVFINTEYISRYVLILVLCISPCLAIFADSEKTPVITRTILSFVSVVMLFSSSFVTYTSVLSSNGNMHRKAVVDFLQMENYTFGYSEFENANVISYLTDGKIEVQRMDFPNRKFLATERYNEPDYKTNEKVFLLLSSGSTKKFSEVFECENATKVYEDKFYTVLTFKSNDIFRSEWGKKDGHLYRLSFRDHMIE